VSVTIVFLGPLRDLAKAECRDVSAPLDWTGLLAAVGPEIAEQLLADQLYVACGGKVLANKLSLYAMDGDEVALLPPVSGG
jgi:molybdopterin synthase sulfur carrier subunit